MSENGLMTTSATNDVLVIGLHDNLVEGRTPSMRTGELTAMRQLIHMRAIALKRDGKCSAGLRTCSIVTMKLGA